MKLLVVLVAALLMIGVVAVVAIVAAILPALRQRSEVAFLTQLRMEALANASLEYGRERPGLAVEYERTAEALLDQIRVRTAEASFDTRTSSKSRNLD